MFDIGFFELLLLLALGLIIVGPDRLPELVRSALAHWRRLRNRLFDMRQDLERELDVHSLSQDLHNRDLMRELEEQERAEAVDEIPGKSRDSAPPP